MKVFHEKSFFHKVNNGHPIFYIPREREASRQVIRRLSAVYPVYRFRGDSLSGALLDARPNMIVAHELNTLKYF